jgi:hypothetical protein
MKMDYGKIIAKVLPLVIAAISLKFCIDSWWQVIDPIGYFKGVLDETPSVFYLMKAILLTFMIGVSIATVFGYKTGYFIITGILGLSGVISLYFLVCYLTDLDSSRYGLNLNNWTYTELPYTPHEKFDNIYLPIIYSFLITISIVLGIWLWTRKRVHSRFIDKKVS